MKKIELLAPAGDLEKLKIAVLYGADAIFIGGEHFSLRSRASNFTIADLKEACSFAHEHNAKVHVTCNIVMHNIDLDGLKEYLETLAAVGVDAIITSSIYMLKLAKKYTNLEVHMSTQLSTLNSEAVEFWTNLGADRVVLGRELSMDEIATIKGKAQVEIEAFIHGGMCASLSGRCMLSNNMTWRDANRGGCAHSCRWNYNLYQNDTKINPEGDYFSFSAKDLEAIRYVPQLIEAGIDSLKIEGRMKSIHYVATVTNTYRHLIDEYYENGKIVDYDKYYTMLKKAENRLLSTGFYAGEVTKNEQLYDLNLSVPTKNFIGLVLRYDEQNQICYIEQRNYFTSGDVVEVFTPQKTFNLKIEQLYDLDGNEVMIARHPRQLLYFKTAIKLEPYDMLRAL